MTIQTGGEAEGYNEPQVTQVTQGTLEWKRSQIDGEVIEATPDARLR